MSEVELREVRRGPPARATSPVELRDAQPDSQSSAAEVWVSKGGLAESKVSLKEGSSLRNMQKKALQLNIGLGLCCFPPLLS